MSQIVTIKSLQVRDLNLAEQIAIKNGFIVQKQKTISGIGDKNVDYYYCLNDKPHIEFGLIKNESGTFDIKCDNSFEKIVNNKFTSNYSKEYLTREAILSGNKSTSISETETEIEIIIN